jgi:hypothetical protein
MKQIMIFTMLVLGTSIYGQGLGLSYEEVLEKRINDEFVTGVKNDIPYLKYPCGNEQFCTSTVYMFLDDTVFVVFDIYKLELLNNAIQFINETSTKVGELEWIDNQTKNMIKLQVNQEFDQFAIIYTSPKPKE